ncbi:MAG: radical SAM protein [Deltaproteobacteria bacterium]|nr:radical SAM protein [Deltaproteobacteria bacterium]MCB9480160.1 radical SAM protein [Deltaproteobacteria bacterium]MCB9487979.1 radical SAM protein [Deltaproteobacteria bacterium]
MSNVTLVQGSVYYPDVEKAPPLGVMYLASYLRTQGFAPQVIDMKGHNMTTRNFVDAYRETMNPYIGIGTITYDSRALHDCAAGIKEVNPSAFVIAGGPHATAYAEDILKQDRNIDAVVLNEGEAAFADLVRTHESGGDLSAVSGLVVRLDDEVIRTAPRPLIQELDELPFPAWDTIPLKEYWDLPRIAWVYKNREYATITTSRGCPYRCAYCHRTLGKTWRTRSIDSVIDEMWRLKRDHGVKEIVPVDDMFNLSVKRTNEFARRVIDEKLDMSFHFPVGFRCDILDEESVELLKAAGMYRCMVAIETGSPRVQKVIDRNLNLKKTKEMIGKIADKDVLVHGVFILGLPTETKEDMEETMRFALESKLHSMAISIAIPFKDCGLTDLAKKDGIAFEDSFDSYNYTQSTTNLTHVPTDWVLKHRRTMYRRFFSPRRVYRFLRLLPNRWTHSRRLIKVFVRKAFMW